jgi:hypothetical protein
MTMQTTKMRTMHGCQRRRQKHFLRTLGKIGSGRKTRLAAKQRKKGEASGERRRRWASSLEG